MKSIYLIITILVIGTSRINASDHIKSTVEPGESFENKTSKDVYILVKLNPGESFENSSPDTALVYREGEFLKRFYYHDLYPRMEKFEVNIKSDQKLMQILDDDIARIQGKQVEEEQ